MSLHPFALVSLASGTGANVDCRSRKEGGGVRKQTYQEQLGLVIAREDGAVVGARVREQLAAVDGDGREG